MKSEYIMRGIPMPKDINLWCGNCCETTLIDYNKIPHLPDEFREKYDNQRLCHACAKTLISLLEEI